MRTIEIKNNRSYYTTCTHYWKGSEKWIKSMRIANKLLTKQFPDYKFIHCECMFPQYDSKFIVIKRLKVNIVCEVSTIHSNRIFFSFFI